MIIVQIAEVSSIVFDPFSVFVIKNTKAGMQQSRNTMPKMTSPWFPYPA
jgi:hypothetical protein